MHVFHVCIYNVCICDPPHQKRYNVNIQAYTYIYIYIHTIYVGVSIVYMKTYGSDHAVVASNSRLYEEGEVVHINGPAQSQLYVVANTYVMTSTSSGCVALLRMTIKSPHSLESRPLD